MKLFFKLFFLALVTAAGAFGAVWWYVQQAPHLAADEVDFSVPRGANLRQAMQALATAGIDVEPEIMYWAARAGSQGRHVVAGSYVATRGETRWQLVDKMWRGDVARVQVRLIEGWNFRQMRAAIEGNTLLRGDTRELDDKALLAKIGATESHPEGLFFPDTYVVDRHSSALEVFRAAYRAMQREVEQTWQQRADDTPLKSPYEALTLASIIEKETGRAEERGLVASVFANRLRIGMRLQTDPTVIYGYGEEFEGRLRRRHLDTDHPYNTYTRAGLPPTPIAMPGRAALLAAVKPADSKYLYFVARGDGTSEFSTDLAAHNRAVDRYQRGKGGAMAGMSGMGGTP